MNFFGNLLGGLAQGMGAGQQPGGQMRGGHQGFGMPPQQFKQFYKCHSLAFASKEALMALEQGDKVVLPASALDALSQMNVAYPMQFEIMNPETQMLKHCGVMEFSAPEGIVYIPHWIMMNLAIKEGQMVQFSNVSLQKGTLVQFQPHKTAFTEISNPKAVLEKALRGFTCLTKNDEIPITFNNKTYTLSITEVKPQNAVCIVEADVNVDFKEPKDYAQHVARAEAAKRDALVDTASASATRSAAASKSRSPSLRPMARPDSARFHHGADESSSPDYFSRLGAGHSITNKRSAPSTTTTKPASSNSSSNGSKSGGSSGETQRVSFVEGQWRFVYEVNKRTREKTLIKKVPLAQGSSFLAFKGQGNSLKAKRR